MLRSVPSPRLFSLASLFDLNSDFHNFKTVLNSNSRFCLLFISVFVLRFPWLWVFRL